MKVVFCKSTFLFILFFSVKLFSQNLNWYQESISTKFGFKNSKGKVVIPHQFDFVKTFVDGWCPVSKKEKWFFIDSTGKEMNSVRYDDAEDFYEGMAKVAIGMSNEKKFGFIDLTGKEIISLQYDDARNFVSGLAAVKRGNKWGYIDKQGKEVMKFEYDDAYEFWDDLAAVNLSGKWGYIDKNGKMIIPCQFKQAHSFYGGVAAVQQDSSWYFIDKTARPLCTKYFSNVMLGPFNRSLYGKDKIGFAAFTLEDEKVTFLSENNNVTHADLFCKYDGIDIFVDGFAIVRKGDKYGIVSSSGKEVIEPKYDQFLVEKRNFNSGLVCAILNGKYGYLDTTGKVVIPFKYDFAAPFRNNTAIVNMGGMPDVTTHEWAFEGKWGLIDPSGKELTAVKYDDVSVRGFCDGLLAVCLGGTPNFMGEIEGGKWGFIDEKGRAVIPHKYDRVEYFSEGLAEFSVTTDRKDLYGQSIFVTGYIDKKGKVIIPPMECQYAGPFLNGKAFIWLNNGEKYLIDKKGKKSKID